MSNFVDTKEGKGMLPAFMEIINQDQREDQNVYSHNTRYHTI